MASQDTNKPKKFFEIWVKASSEFINNDVYLNVALSFHRNMVSHSGEHLLRDMGHVYMTLHWLLEVRQSELLIRISLANHLEI